MMMGRVLLLVLYKHYTHLITGRVDYVYINEKENTQWKNESRNYIRFSCSSSEIWYGFY